jgi:crossover junction endodeoxyribonuclease RuvC
MGGLGSGGRAAGQQGAHILVFVTFVRVPNAIKKAVVGVGHADKRQIDMMVRTLLPGCAPASPDAADALAVAICHAHHAATARRLSVAVAAGAAP